MKMLTVFALLCAMMALTTAATPPEAEAKEDETGKSHLDERTRFCPRGWRRCGRRCVRYFRKPLTWAHAEKTCRSLGANLASVHSAYEYRVIQRLIATVTCGSNPAWLGGSDIQKEGVWQWSDGTRFNYRNWCPGEPNNGRCNQDCLS